MQTIAKILLILFVIANVAPADSGSLEVSSDGCSQCVEAIPGDCLDSCLDTASVEATLCEGDCQIDCTHAEHDCPAGSHEDQHHDHCLCHGATIGLASLGETMIQPPHLDGLSVLRTQNGPPDSPAYPLDRPPIA